MKIFGNPGTLDPRAFTTFGISAKVNDNPIGQFGTGLKYAIAVMVREDLSLHIETNGKKYVFDSASTEFRNKDFQLVQCNIFDLESGNFDRCIELPFTTEFGKNWQLWQVYRELASNCLDENGTIGEPGETTVYANIPVEHSEVFLVGKNKVYESELIEIFDNPNSQYIYYQGIRVLKMDLPGRYTYNLKKATLTEDRTLFGTAVYHKAICNWVATSTDEILIRQICGICPDTTFESKLDFDYFDAASVSNEFLQYFKKNALCTDGTNQSAYRLAKKQQKEIDGILRKEPSLKEQKTIDEAIEFLFDIGYDVLDKYSVSIASNLGDNILAYADDENQTMWLTSKLLTDTPRQIAAGIFEEYIHLEHNVYDCTRQMQNVLFDEIMKQGAERIGVTI